MTVSFISPNGELRVADPCKADIRALMQLGLLAEAHVEAHAFCSKQFSEATGTRDHIWTQYLPIYNISWAKLGHALIHTLVDGKRTLVRPNGPWQLRVQTMIPRASTEPR